MFQGSFNSVSDKFQGCFKKFKRVLAFQVVLSRFQRHLKTFTRWGREIQGCLKEISSVFQEIIGGISRKFFGNFKKVSRVFQGRLKGVSREFSVGLKEI